MSTEITQEKYLTLVNETDEYLRETLQFDHAELIESIPFDEIGWLFNKYVPDAQSDLIEEHLELYARYFIETNRYPYRQICQFPYRGEVYKRLCTNLEVIERDIVKQKYLLKSEHKWALPMLLKWIEVSLMEWDKYLNNLNSGKTSNTSVCYYHRKYI